MKPNDFEERFEQLILAEAPQSEGAVIWFYKEQMLSFIQSEITQARKEERERILNLIKVWTNDNRHGGGFSKGDVDVLELEDYIESLRTDNLEEE